MLGGGAGAMGFGFLMQSFQSMFVFKLGMAATLLKRVLTGAAMRLYAPQIEPHRVRDLPPSHTR
jgi:hypothetical protein